MIQQLKITNYLNNAVTIDLFHPETSSFNIYNITGLGPGRAEVHITEIASTDGGKYNSARLPSRNIVLYIKFFDTNIEQARYKSYRFFPIKRPITLEITTDSRQAEIVGYVESNEPVIFEKEEYTQISIVCEDPYFYKSGDGSTEVVSFYSLLPLFEFPFSNESLTDNLIEFGSIETYTEKNIEYYGDAPIGFYMSIYAIGPVGDITIYNIGTRETMSISVSKIEQLTGSPIIARDEIIISTLRRQKYITLLREGQTYNILNALNKDADWFQLNYGDNMFAITTTEGQSNLQFRIEKQTIYEGM